MFTELLIGMEGWYSKKCKLTWKMQGTKYKRLYFRLQVLTLPTNEIEFGLLPTAVASDATTGAIIGKNDKVIITKTGMPRKINQNGTDGSVGLARLGKLGMLPTPRARAAGGNTSNDRNKGNLEDVIAKMMLPTPNASEGEKYCKTYNKNSQMGTALTPLMNQITGKSSQLKPQFVMEMMGFPPDWTLLPFLNGEQKALKEEETQ
jgi:hypothetical protein